MPERPSPHRARRAGAVAIGLAVLVSGCSSDGPAGGNGPGPTDGPDPAVVADSSLTDPASYADPDRTVAEEPGFVQADANTATSAQLVTAFETNGIADAATWAAEVIGHRPYSTTALDPFEDLRVALIAAGLDELTAGAVVASLTV